MIIENNDYVHDTAQINKSIKCVLQSLRNIKKIKHNIKKMKHPCAKIWDSNLNKNDKA